MLLGKYYVIRSEINGMVFTVKEGESSPGTEVVTWPRKDGEDNPSQTWVDDHLAGCIRTKLNEDLCLTVNDANVLTVDTFTGADNQRWYANRDRIQSCPNPDKVLDLMKSRKEEGSPIGAWKHHGGDNQYWHFDYLKVRFFTIVSYLNGKRIWCNNGKLKMHDAEEGDDYQFWYEHRHGGISCKANNLVMCNKEGLGTTVRVEPYELGAHYQMWIRSGNKITNRVQPSHVLDIEGNNWTEGANLISREYNDQVNQHWHFQDV